MTCRLGALQLVLRLHLVLLSVGSRRFLGGLALLKDVWPVPEGTGHNHQFKRTGNLTVR